MFDRRLFLVGLYFIDILLHGALVFGWSSIVDIYSKGVLKFETKLQNWTKTRKNFLLLETSESNSDVAKECWF